MKTQYTVENVLIRPLESASTRFLSSRYYNGKKIIDSLNSPAEAEHWFKVNADELSTSPPFPLTEADVSQLQHLRSDIRALYRSVLEDENNNTSAEINSLLDDRGLSPCAIAAAPYVRLIFTKDKASPLEEFMGGVIVSAGLTLSPPQVLRLEQCEGPNCVLFYTKLRDSQHWCSNTCGNRARVARHASKHP